MVAKFGVKPLSIPDYLAVVGDSADGFPGVPGWGEKAAAATLSRYFRLEEIPKDWRDWHPSIAKARRLSTSLFQSWNDALLFRTLATLRLDAPVFDTINWDVHFTWSEATKFVTAQDVGKMMMAIFELAGLLLLICFGGGLLFAGYLIWRRRKEGLTDAQAVALHLD